MYKGYFEKHSNTDGLSGWCVYDDESLRTVDGEVSLDVYANEVFLRRITTFLNREDIRKSHGVKKAGFNLALSSRVIDLIPEGTTLSIIAKDGCEVNLLHGKNVKPLGRATDDGEKLKSVMAEGYMVDKWGSLKLPFSAKPHLRANYMAALHEVTEIFYKRLGLMVIPAYGTLLGLARDAKFIEHDDDVDLAIVMPFFDMNSLARHILEIVETLKSDGHTVSVVNIGQFHITLKDSGLPDIDMFVAWQEPDLSFYSYFGVGGQLDSRLSYFSKELEGQQVTVPVCYEDILGLTYGPTWKEPDPNFQWSVSSEVRQKMLELELAGKSVVTETIGSAA